MSPARDLSWLLVAAGLAACSPALSDGTGDGGPLDLVDRLIDARPLEKAEVERLTGVRLVPDRSASNPFYSLWISERGAGFLEKVELREPGEGATRRGGLVILDFDAARAGLVHHRVAERYGREFVYEPPRAHGPPNAPAYYLYRRPWGDLRFGFRLSDGAVITVVIDAER